MNNHPVLFDVPEEMWVRRRCAVCGCALSVTYEYTYVVQRQDWVKIGATNLPRRRLNELARPAWRKHVLHPKGMDWNSPLKVLAVVGGDVEHELHKEFSDSHDTGEWFYNDESIHEWLKEVT
jgi:hypothetical protein